MKNEGLYEHEKIRKPWKVSETQVYLSMMILLRL